MLHGVAATAGMVASADMNVQVRVAGYRQDKAFLLFFLLVSLMSLCHNCSVGPICQQSELHCERRMTVYPCVYFDADYVDSPLLSLH